MEIIIPSPAGNLKGYLAAKPAGGGNRPGIVVLHDITGMNDDARVYADRFSTAGYTAVAPDLYSRGKCAIQCIRSVLRQLEAGSGAAFDDIEASRQFLLSQVDSSGKVGVVGFCMGGGFALLAAVKDFDASAPYYPYVNTDRYGALEGACPVVASFGAKDAFLGSGRAAKLESTLTAYDVPHDVKQYPEVGHSFANRPPTIVYAASTILTGSRYNHDASEDAWQRVVAFFDQHLRTSGSG